MAGTLGLGPARRVIVCAHAWRAQRGGRGSRGSPTPEQALKLLTLWTFLDPKASVALNVTQRRETQHGQPSVEHFSHGPQKLQTGKHLTEQVWPRLLEERRRLVSSFAFPVPPAPTCPSAVHLPLGCVPGYSMS